MTNRITIEQLTSYEIACEVLGIKPIKKPFVEKELKTIIKAANFIDNNYVEWIPNFDNNALYKYIPYFNKVRSGWSLFCVGDFYDISDCSVWYYYKSRETANTIATRFLPLYNKWLNE